MLDSNQPTPKLMRYSRAISTSLRIEWNSTLDKQTFELVYAPHDNSGVYIRIELTENELLRLGYEIEPFFTYINDHR